MDIVINRATAGDIKKLIEWRMEVLAEVFSDADEPDWEKLRKENIAYYRKEISAGGHIAVFADSDGETAGCGGVCIYKEMPSPDNPTGMCAYLMNIYTRPQYRGKGVAKAVVSYLIKTAKDAGITKIYLESTKEAKKMYEGLGFSDMIDYMKLK